MSKNISVILDPRSRDFVETQVAEGRYGDAEGVVREGLRLLEERETRRAVLREALAAGEAGGFMEDAFDFDAFIAEMHNEADRAK